MKKQKSLLSILLSAVMAMSMIVSPVTAAAAETGAVNYAAAAEVRAAGYAAAEEKAGAPAQETPDDSETPGGKEAADKETEPEKESGGDSTDPGADIATEDEAAPTDGKAEETEGNTDKDGTVEESAEKTPENGEAEGAKEETTSDAAAEEEIADEEPAQEDLSDGETVEDAEEEFTFEGNSFDAVSDNSPYGLVVGGVAVTPSNKDDIRGTNIISGKGSVKYDPDTHILTQNRWMSAARFGEI